MAKSLTLNTNVSPAVANEIRSALTGIGGGFDPSKYKVQTGIEVAEGERPFNLMVFGPRGSGKTYIAVSLLRLGFKVVLITTDFGKLGYETIFSYFETHPEERHLLANLRMVTLDYDGFYAFSKDPTVFPGFADIYEWDPDWIFWDGASAYQEIEAEKEASGTESDFREMDWGAWKKTRAATLYPMDRILSMRNVRTGRPWMKVVTMLEKEEAEYVNEKDRNGNFQRTKVAGSEFTGPLLHSSAKQLASAGFSLVMHLEHTFNVTGTKDIFRWTTNALGVETKQRGYGIPNVVDNKTFEDIWKEYIGAKALPFKCETVKADVTEVEPDAS